MLSRVADNLYWMSRYLERAEHTARLIGVALDQMLDQTPASADPRWQRLLASRRMATPAEGNDPYAIVQTLTFDVANPGSIVSCIASARENARQVREQTSSEMWEELNRLSLRVRRSNMHEIWHTEPQAFFATVKEGAHLFHGVTDGTMTHDEGWYFIQVGRYIERASATATLLDQHFRPASATASTTAQLDYIDWVGLLKSCTAFEAYCKVYTAEVEPDHIAEFLLLNPSFPRSLCFAADQIRHGLHQITRFTGTRNAGRVERLAGRLQSALDYAQIDEIMADGLHAYLENIQRQCSDIHNTIYRVYVSYPVETALAASNIQNQ